MSLGELYGEYDLTTDEWADGVLSSLMRSACAGVRTLKTLPLYSSSSNTKLVLFTLYQTYIPSAEAQGSDMCG